MKILVANLGSTSFKYRLFDMTDEKVLARGGVERIGSDQSRCFVEVGGVKRGSDPGREGSRRGRAAVSASSWPTKKCLSEPARTGRDRLQGGARPGTDRRAPRR